MSSTPRAALAVLCLIALCTAHAAAATFQNSTIRLTLPDDEAAGLEPLRTSRGLVLVTGSLAILLPDDTATDDASLRRRFGPGPTLSPPLQFLDLSSVRLGARTVPVEEGRQLMQVVAVIQQGGGAVPLIIEVEEKPEDMPASDDLLMLVEALAAGTQIVAPDPAADTLGDAAPVPIQPHRIKAAAGVPAPGDAQALDPGQPMSGTWFGMTTTQDVINGFRATPHLIAFDPRGWFVDGTRAALTPDVTDAQLREGLAQNPDAGGTYTADAAGVTLRTADGGLTRAVRGTDATGKRTLTIDRLVLIEKHPPPDGTPLAGRYFWANGTQMGAGANQSNTLNRIDLTFSKDGRYRRRGLQMRVVGSDWIDDARVAVNRSANQDEQGTYRINAGVLTLTPDGANPLDAAATFPVIDLNGDLLIGGRMFHNAGD